MKSALVCGGSGFIGYHLVERLKTEGYWVRSVDLKRSSYGETLADDFILGDLTFPSVVNKAMRAPLQTSSHDTDHSFDEVYQLADDYHSISTTAETTHDATIVTHATQINLLICQYATLYNVKKLFYSSSTNVYPLHKTSDLISSNLVYSEDAAYPALPTNEYGWGQLFNERLYLTYYRNYNLPVRIGRYHNIYGQYAIPNDNVRVTPESICRKVALAKHADTINISDNGSSIRSFLHIDDCIDATIQLTRSDLIGPVNIAAEEVTDINNLTQMIIGFSGKMLNIENTNDTNDMDQTNPTIRLIQSKLGWTPKLTLQDGIGLTYKLIQERINDVD